MWSIIGVFGFLGLGLMTSLGLLVIEYLARVLKKKISPPGSTNKPNEKKLSLFSWKYWLLFDHKSQWKYLNYLSVSGAKCVLKLGYRALHLT